MNEPDDSRWVQACLQGDHNAFRHLVGRHGDVVYNLAYRMTGNASTAEDLAQETFIRAHDRLHQYKPEFAFRNWLLGICANLARSRYRWWRRNQRMEAEFAQHEVLRQEASAAQDDSSSARDALAQALMTLPERLRAPLVLRYMEGLSVLEVAQVLDIRLSAAKMRLARGRDRLRETLARAGVEGMT